MHIGIDFDNTIVNYDDVFHKYALAYKLIPEGVAKKKRFVRDAVQKLPQGNDKWTVLQGKVYGTYLLEAKPTRGIKTFLRGCHRRGITISIVSHKTTYTAMGPKVNLREASIRWLQRKGFFDRDGIAESRVYFAESLEEKLAIIRDIGCTHFIDDLVFVLTREAFPPDVQKILYTDADHKDLNQTIRRFTSWRAIAAYLFFPQYDDD